MYSILHDAPARRFHTTVEGHDAYVEYALDGDVMVITRTVVPDAIGGRGIAGELVKTSLDHARQVGLKVDQVCSYADAWIDRHPDYADLRNI